MCSDCGDEYGSIINCSAPPLNESYSVCAKLGMSLIVKRGCAIPRLGRRYTVSRLEIFKNVKKIIPTSPELF